MPVKTHLKIVFRGDFAGTPEEWSYSTKWSRAVIGGPDAGVNDINGAAVLTALQAFHNNARFPSAVRVQEWRAYVIGTDGRMEGNPRLEDLSSAPVAGTGVVRFPPDQALCVTTEAANRGHARFGRFYLPTPSTGIAGTDLRLSVADAQAWVTATTTFLKAVSDAIDIPGTIESAEMLNISNDATSTFQPVRNIRVGRVLDRIERRRRSLEEAYEASGTIDW